MDQPEQADADGDGVLSVDEWLKFSEPLRDMPAAGFVRLMGSFAKALRAEDATAVIDKVRKKQMFATQDAYDDQLHEVSCSASALLL